MTLTLEILVNKYGQELDSFDNLFNFYDQFSEDEKRTFLNDMLFLMLQSKPVESDIDVAIRDSGLKPSYTPCVLLKKGVANHNLQRIISLPGNELSKVFKLLMSLFKVAYRRRFNEERNNPGKWWYWDLSEQINIEKIEKMLYPRDDVKEGDKRFN